MHSPLTINDLQAQLQAALEAASHSKNLEKLLPPEGGRLRVSLRDKCGRPIDGAAPADAWSADSGEILIAFEPSFMAAAPPRTGKPLGWSFKPVEITGEPLSATVMRERR